MRVLLLCTDSYGGHGGIALFNREFASALVADPECDELVVIPRIRPGEVGPVPGKVTFVDDAANGNASYLRALARARGTRFDLVICGHVNLLPVACTLSDSPLLIVHGIEAWKPLRGPVRRTLVHRCRGVISVSALTRDRFAGASGYTGPTYVLPNTVHQEHYGIRTRREDLLDRYGLRGKRVLLTLGRLVSAERYKGFDEVLEILPQLPHDVTYIIAGSGDDASRLRTKADSLGVAERVVFTGFFPDHEKADLYNLADVYVMPSRGEGFGFVFLEAMACGTPVIGSRLDGGREALLNGTLGQLVDPTNQAELLLAVRTELEAGRRGIPAGLDFFSYGRFVERVALILSQAR